MKYIYLLTENSLAKVGVLRKLFRKLAISVFPYNGVNRAAMRVDEVVLVEVCVEFPPIALL